MNVASSLDGRSCTEYSYEIVDGISSIEIENLLLDSEDDEGCVEMEEDKEVKSEGNCNQVGNDRAILASLSSSSTLPRLIHTPFC